MNTDLVNKYALVCGSTQGIGWATAQEIASLGATVTLFARNEEKLKECVVELPRPQDQVHSYICGDFSQPNKISELLRIFIDSHHPFDILVNNTGGPAGGPIVDAELEQFEKTFALHLLSNHALVQVVIPHMKAQKWGRIVNVISTSVREPIRGLGVSNTIRGAVASWSKTLAGEMAPYGITVNNVLPGPTNTKRLLNLIESKANKASKSVSEAMDEFVSQVPMGRIGEPQETAAAVAFLASPAASFITGVNLPVDGGRISCI
ncbi:MAG: SDR family oxidoreductase [Bdellovibrionales bacterium]|nr:SDR family oxidoreductase [Bdellovibrionales bacterium]